MSTAQSLGSSRWLKTMAASLLIATTAITASASPELLWHAESPTGQWKAFGKGVLDSSSLSGAPGVTIQVDWDQATFGTGLSFEQREGGAPFPAVPQRGRLTFEARLVTDSQEDAPLVARAEWVERGGNGQEQVSPMALKGTAVGEEQWVRYEFEFNDSAPRFKELRSRFNALRLVFPKDARGGQSRVEVRNVELHEE